ncbi:TadE family protein [uncultured Pseudodesulfovibrio sp.]|uniref:TadE family protein n=1 Tax=uncultured Pseudodesulfovibrio sp. TaxID=2035858 RepID=UPI0029C66C4A|nr:TadE family protein [uncultured Pseudodesulfovibrio sp.]
MMRRNNTHKKKRLGMAAVEMAMLLPVFLILMMGVMDAARLFWTRGVVRDAAFEGARMAVLNEPTLNQIKDVIQKELIAGGVEQAALVQVGPREPSEPVDVTVSVPFEFLVLGNLIPSVADSCSQVAATAVMTHER